MSSQQSATSIPFVHAPDGVGYRLIELPPELVAETSNPWHLHSDSTGMARLRTAQGRTYALRQKNTSNALLVLSVRSDLGSSSSAAGSDALPQPGIAAVAALHETVELVEVAAEEETSSQTAPVRKAAPARGKWHEKFGKGR